MLRSTLLLTLLTVSCCLGASGSSATEPTPLQIRVRGAMAVTDSIRRTGDHEGALAYLDGLYRESQEAADSLATLDVMRLEAFWWRKLGDTPSAVARGREAIEWAQALRDTTRLCSELYKLGLAVTDLGQIERADSLYNAVLHIAQISGDETYQARAYSAIGHRAVFSGDLERARANLEPAVETLHRLGKPRDELLALNLLGISWSTAGEFERARSCFERCLELSEELDYPFGRMQGLSNLAYLENHLGDPGRAARGYREVYELAVEMGSSSTAINSGSNYASTLRTLGRSDEAIAMLEQLLVDAQSGELLEQECNVRIHLGAALVEARRFSEGIEHLEVAAERARDFDFAEGEFRAIRTQAEGMAEQGDIAAAIELLSGRGRALQDRVNLTQSLPMLQHLATLHLTQQQPERSLALMREIDARALDTGQRSVRLGALAGMGQVYRSMDRPDSAVAVLTRAARVWEEERNVPRDPEWREQRGSLARRLYTDLADALLEDPSEPDPEKRIRTAFDTLQHYKARTLWERMMGPATEIAEDRFAPPDLAQIQRQLLEPGEVVLDAYVGGDASLLFAVSKDRCEVHRLGPAESLAARLGLFLRLLADPESDPGSLLLARSAMRESLLGDMHEELSQATRILFLPDGSLNRLPLASLWDEGTDVEVARVPSMAVLSQIRTRATPERPTGNPHIVAVAGSANDEGKTLRGALAEVEELRRSYQNVSPYTGGLPEGRDLQHANVVHFAAHTRVDDQRPWRSGLLLASRQPEYVRAVESGQNSEGVILRAATNEGEMGTSYLDAASIAELPLEAQLAVLSGCESAGGRVLSGEGVQGLANAFLSARVRTVVATLWPVDDGSTRRFMSAFYRALSEGLSVAAALQSARSDLRSDPATAHPFHWSGFVVLGDGSTEVAISPRAALPGARTVLGILAAAALLMVLGWRRSGSL